jgi:hypothetical protein
MPAKKYSALSRAKNAEVSGAQSLARLNSAQMMATRFCSTPFQNAAHKNNL